MLGNNGDNDSENSNAGMSKCCYRDMLTDQTGGDKAHWAAADFKDKWFSV